MKTGFKKICVYGLGLLGGSICLRARNAYPGCEIYAFARYPEKLKQALNSSMIDFAETIDTKPPQGTDLVVVATPVEASINIIRMVLDSEIEDSALVIDVGSVKGRVVRSALSSSKSELFVGCHPIAGSEKSGYENSYPALYDGSIVFITPSEVNTQEKLIEAAGFWEQMGASCEEVDPFEHDRIVAYTSHLPHFAASAVTAALRDYIKREGFTGDICRFIGNGFRDTTRVSAGSPAMWTEISSMNSENILTSIDILIDILTDMKQAIAAEPEAPGRISGLLDEIRVFRTGIK